MVQDAYANYVVQTALDVVAKGEEKVELLKVLYAHSEQSVSLSNNFPLNKFYNHYLVTYKITFPPLTNRLYLFLCHSATILLQRILWQSYVADELHK